MVPQDFGDPTLDRFVGEPFGGEIVDFIALGNIGDQSEKIPERLWRLRSDNSRPELPQSPPFVLAVNEIGDPNMLNSVFRLNLLLERFSQQFIFALCFREQEGWRIKLG